MGRLCPQADELVILAEGEIEVETEGKVPRPQIGEEVFIPANAVHTVKNVGRATLQNKLEFENLSRITSFMLIIALDKLS